METTVRVWKDPKFLPEERPEELEAPLIAELESIEAEVSAEAQSTSATAWAN